MAAISLYLVLLCMAVFSTATIIPHRPQVAFSAARSSDVRADDNPVTVTYDITHCNVGGGYRIYSGHFIAPVSGLYQFAMSMRARGGSRGMLQLKVNGNTIMSIYDKDWGGDSNQVILDLAEGDDVYTEIQKYKVHFGGDDQGFSTFSGHLL